QLKPVLAANADVIAYLQAGLIGPWGEGHGPSSNSLDSPANTAAIRDAWLANAPANYAIQFRPVDVQTWGGMARIGAKNDCFMANDTDAYHFPGGLPDPLRTYIKAIDANTVYGGETCSDVSNLSQARLNCADILT